MLNPTLDHAVAILTRVTIADRPTPAEVVAALRTIERSHPGEPLRLADLLGTWRLTFVTGTTKTRQRAGRAIGAGRYLPGLPKITLAYGAETNSEAQLSRSGRAVNTVAIGSLKLTVTGPIEAITGKRILAFDFTRWSVAIGHWVVYRGELGQGAASEATFADRPLKQRPFFNYFWVSANAIAARGKGGGLAIWVRLDEVETPPIVPG